MSDWGLGSPTMTDDPWDYAHITCLEFSALRASACWRGSHLGRARDFWNLVCGAGRIGRHIASHPKRG